MPVKHYIENILFFLKKLLTKPSLRDIMNIPLSEGFFCAQIWDTHIFDIEGGIYGFTRILLGGAENYESQNYTRLH